jgi:glycosyltransferase involved in cell wall biosynthesis
MFDRTQSLSSSRKLPRKPQGSKPNETRRIAMVIDSFQAGGAERIAVEVASSLDRERYSPIVLATRHGGPLEDLLDRAGVDYVVLGRRHGFSPRKYRRAHRLLRNVDLIHSHKLGSILWGALFSRTTGVPLVARDPTFSGIRTRLRTYGYRWWIAPVARCIICPTANLAQSLYDEGVPHGLVEVIPNGVRLDAALPRDEARAELGLDPDAFVVGIVAQLREEKAHEVLFRAVAQLREDGRDVRLCVVGDGSRRAALVEAAASLGLDGSVTWAGERAEAKRLPAAFDVGVICSDFEGLPVAALETLAAGVPMVCTAVGTLPDILSGGAGLTVPVRDHAALAAAIRRFIDDPAARAHAGARARDVVRRHYEFEQMVRAFERVYDRVLGRNAPG